MDVRREERTSEKYYSSAFDGMKILAKDGDSTAQTLLGNMFRLGLSTDSDFVKALFWYKKAEEKKHPIACFQIGNMFALGQGVKRNMATAQKWYRRAADLGYPQGLFNLGMAYEHGSNLVNGDRDINEAIRWFQAAADIGYPQAMAYLGRLYENEKSPHDYKLALEWFRKAATYEFISAYGEIGQIYEYGLGVQMDHKKAKYWYLKQFAKDPSSARDAIERVTPMEVSIKKSKIFESISWNIPKLDTNSISSETRIEKVKVMGDSKYLYIWMIATKPILDFLNQTFPSEDIGTNNGTVDALLFIDSDNNPQTGVAIPENPLRKGYDFSVSIGISKGIKRNSKHISDYRGYTGIRNLYSNTERSSSPTHTIFQNNYIASRIPYYALKIAPGQKIRICYFIPKYPLNSPDHLYPDRTLKLGK